MRVLVERSTRVDQLTAGFALLRWPFQARPPSLHPPSSYPREVSPGITATRCAWLKNPIAATAIWSGTDCGDPFRFHNFRTLHQLEHREKIGFVNEHGRLKNQLHREVSALPANGVTELFRHRSAESEALMAHTGARDGIDAIEHSIPAHKLVSTRQTLRKSVFF